MQALGKFLDVVEQRREHRVVGRHPSGGDLRHQMPQRLDHRGDGAVLVLDDRDRLHFAWALPVADHATDTSRCSVASSASSSVLADRCTTRPRSSTTACRVSDERELRVLLDDDHGHAALREQIADHVHQFLHDDRREPLHRLVQQQQARIDHQRAADREHLLLAARQLVAEVAAPLGETRKHLVHARDVPVPGPRHGRQVLLDRERREHEPLLRHPAQARLAAAIGRQRGEVLAAPAHRAAAHAREPHQRDQQRRLAHAVAPEQREAVAFVQRERDVFQHDAVAVARGDAVDRQQLSHAAPRPGTPRARADRRRSRPARLPSARGRPRAP